MINKVYAQGKVNIAKEYGFGDLESLGEGLSRLVPLAFAIAALLVVFYFLLGAFDLIISHGDKNAIASARAKITHAIIGFALLIFLFLVLQFLPDALLGPANLLRIVR